MIKVIPNLESLKDRWECDDIHVEILFKSGKILNFYYIEEFIDQNNRKLVSIEHQKGNSTIDISEVVSIDFVAR